MADGRRSKTVRPKEAHGGHVDDQDILRCRGLHRPVDGHEYRRSCCRDHSGSGSIALRRLLDGAELHVCFLSTGFGDLPEARLRTR